MTNIAKTNKLFFKKTSSKLMGKVQSKVTKEENFWEKEALLVAMKPQTLIMERYSQLK